MKSRYSAAISIAFYSLFGLLWLALVTNASKDAENTKISVDLDNNAHFQSCGNIIFSIIFNEFLTIREILTIRQTCTDFQIILLPNDKNNLVMFRKEFGSKQMDHVPLMWSDLKYFLNESYTNALKNMEMWNLKQNQYAVYTRDKKMIFWYNTLNVYPKMIFNKSKNEISNSLAPKTCHKFENPWAEVRNIRDWITGEVATCDRDVLNHVLSEIYLKNIKMIVSTNSAFAALLQDGTVTAWGDKNNGSVIQNFFLQLQNVQIIVSTDFAFAALLQNGNVVSWGSKELGYKIPESIQTKLQNVKTILSNDHTFAAVLGNGHVISWGSRYGIIIPNVKTIFSTKYEFSALLQNGNVIQWFGESNPQQIKTKSKKVKTIFSTDSAFVALSQDGSVFAWGNERYGGKIPSYIESQLYQNVKMIYSNGFAFVASLNNGRFIAWGDERYGGIITPEIQAQLKNVKVIFSLWKAFAALLDNESIVTWGFWDEISTEIKSKLINNVKMILPQKDFLRVICKDGNVVILECKLYD